jgi:hypothetical protein
MNESCDATIWWKNVSDPQQRQPLLRCPPLDPGSSINPPFSSILILPQLLLRDWKRKNKIMCFFFLYVMISMGHINLKQEQNRGSAFLL